MKIGILTLHYTNSNYGGILQTFSIYKLIEDLGYESYIINFKPEIKSVRKKVASSIEAILGSEFTRFRYANIHRILHKTRSINDLKQLNNLVDGFVVGSDQVWRYRDDPNVLSTYFFDFVGDNKTKIAYGASFGINQWNGNEEITNKIKNLIHRFDAVSVREESGVDICKNKFMIESENVLDPTLLLNKNYFHKLADKKPSFKIKHKYLAYMLLDSTNLNEIFFKNFAKDNQFKFVNINGKKVLSKKNFYLFKSVNNWLSRIKNAELVVTDSFHCTVFSIIFHKKFICLANQYRGITRLENLLKLLGLEKRLINDLSQLNKDGILTDINYENVDKLLLKEKETSLNFLKKSLALVDS